MVYVELYGYISRMSEEQSVELRDETYIIKKASGYDVYCIPDEHVKEYFNYGKSRSDISKMLAKELAKKNHGVLRKKKLWKDRFVQCLKKLPTDGVLLFLKKVKIKKY